MNPFKYLMPVLLAFSLTTATAAYAANDDEADDDQETAFEKEQDERSSKLVRDFVKSKRGTPEDRYANLDISGDIRFKWEYNTERLNRHELRRRQYLIRNLPVSGNDFDAEFNLRVAYAKDCSYGIAHIQIDPGCGVGEIFDNCEGSCQGCLGSGESSDLSLKRAFLGLNLLANGCERLDIEFGRQKLYDIFESDIQYLARFDGILLRYAADLKQYGDFSWKLGGFVVDERVNHFAGITELAFLDIYEYGFDVKYSFIHWRNFGKNRCCVEDARGWRFVNSQIYLGYHLDEDILCTPVEFYGAFVHNHAAKKIAAKYKGVILKCACNKCFDIIIEPKEKEKPKKRLNNAWYAGVLIGRVREAGDWSADIRYEWVQAQAIPDCDINGISRGNILNEDFPTDGRGNGNYKGWIFEFLYGITDHTSINAWYEFASPIDKSYGGRHFFSNFKAELIFAF